MTPFAAPAFELRLRLFQLGFLLSRQNGKHFLVKLVALAHQLRLETRHFRQFLSSQCFVERTAFVCLTKLQALGSNQFVQGFVQLAKDLADLLHLGLLVLS
jgi:hypothetical protein